MLESSDQKPVGPSFGQYGNHFQKKILQALLSDPSWAEQMSEVLEPAYFDLKYLHYLAERYLQYSRKYKAYPSLQLLVAIVKDELRQTSDLAMRDQVVEYLRSLKDNPDMGDIPMVKDKSLEFCRRQALKRALEKTVDLIETERYESIVDTIKQAVTVGTTASLGHDLMDDVESRYIDNARKVIPTGFPELDAKKILNGGYSIGDMCTIVASTGVGKSHFLVALGANAMRLGFNVVYYTFELSEAKIGLRFDSNFTGIDTNEIMLRKDEVKKFYESTDKLGKLRIKYYPTNTATVNHLRAHLEKLSLKGFVPDVVLIDYADIMRSSRQYDSPRYEMKLIYEELRSLGMERNVAVWTASQSNRDGSNAEIVDATNMSESFGKAFICDVLLTLSRRPSEKALGTGRLFVAKNRNGMDGIVYPINIDTARSRFSINGEASTPEATIEANEKQIKSRLKNEFEKFSDLNLKKVD